MDKMDTKLDRRDDQYRPRIYQGRNRGCSYRQNNYRSRNRSYSRDQYQNNYRGRGTTIEVVIETTGPLTGIVVCPETETIIEMGIGTTIDQIIEGITVTKGMETEIRTTVARERDRDRSSSRKMSQFRGGNQSNRDQSRNENRRQSSNNTRDRSESRSRSSSCVSTNRDRT